MGTMTPNEQLLAAIFGESTGTVEQQKKAEAARVASLRADAMARSNRPVAQVEEKTSVLSVGEVYTASVPYKLSKKATGLCWLNGALVSVPNVADGGAVRVTSLRTGKAYGLKYEAEGEVV